MHELLITLNQLKVQKKELGKELREALLTNSEFAEMDQVLKDDRETLNSFKDKLISESAQLGALNKKIIDKKSELKLVKQSIRDSIIITDRTTGEQLQMNLF